MVGWLAVFRCDRQLKEAVGLAWTGSGRRYTSARSTDATRAERDATRNTGSTSWSAWPSLLTAARAGRASAPVAASTAPTSKKTPTWEAESRKYESVVLVWSFVEKVAAERAAAASSSTSSRPRRWSAAHSAAEAKPGTTRKPFSL